jgi:hypothetical protein
VASGNMINAIQTYAEKIGLPLNWPLDWPNKDELYKHGKEDSMVQMCESKLPNLPKLRCFNLPSPIDIDEITKAETDEGEKMYYNRVANIFLQFVMEKGSGIVIGSGTKPFHDAEVLDVLDVLDLNHKGKVKFILDCSAGAETFNKMLKCSDIGKEYFIDTIASYWDQSSTKAFTFENVTSDGGKSIKVPYSEPTEVHMNNRSIRLGKSGEPDSHSLLFKLPILKHNVFVPSLSKLCNLAECIINGNEIDPQTIRSNIFNCEVVNRQKIVKVTPSEVDNLVTMLSKFISDIVDPYDKIVTLLNIKQSGDDSLIQSAHPSRFKNRVLVTCDRMCFLKCRLLNVDAIYLGKNNKIKSSTSNLTHVDITPEQRKTAVGMLLDQLVRDIKRKRVTDVEHPHHPHPLTNHNIGTTTYVQDAILHWYPMFAEKLASADDELPLPVSARAQVLIDVLKWKCPFHKYDPETDLMSLFKQFCKAHEWNAEEYIKSFDGIDDRAYSIVNNTSQANLTTTSSKYYEFHSNIHTEQKAGFFERVKEFLFECKKKENFKNKLGFITESYLLNNMTEDLWSKLATLAKADADADFVQYVRNKIDDPKNENDKDVWFDMYYVLNHINTKQSVFAVARISQRIRDSKIDDFKYLLQSSWKKLACYYEEKLKQLNNEVVSQINDALSDIVTHIGNAGDIAVCQGPLALLRTNPDTLLYCGIRFPSIKKVLDDVLGFDLSTHLHIKSQRKQSVEQFVKSLSARSDANTVHVIGSIIDNERLRMENAYNGIMDATQRGLHALVQQRAKPVQDGMKRKRNVRRKRKRPNQENDDDAHNHKKQAVGGGDHVDVDTLINLYERQEDENGFDHYLDALEWDRLIIMYMVPTTKFVIGDSIDFLDIIRNNLKDTSQYMYAIFQKHEWDLENPLVNTIKCLENLRCIMTKLILIRESPSNDAIQKLAKPNSSQTNSKNSDFSTTTTTQIEIGRDDVNSYQTGGNPEDALSLYYKVSLYMLNHELSSFMNENNHVLFNKNHCETLKSRLEKTDFSGIAPFKGAGPFKRQTKPGHKGALPPKITTLVACTCTCTTYVMDHRTHNMLVRLNLRRILDRHNAKRIGVPFIGRS